MKFQKRQIIANAGLNKNNVIFSEEALKECVENIKEEKLLITDQFYEDKWLEYMTNFKYENGKILADVYLNKNFNLNEKIIRGKYEVIEKEGENPINIQKCRLLEGGLIDKKNDAERDLI